MQCAAERLKLSQEDLLVIDCDVIKTMYDVPFLIAAEVHGASVSDCANWAV